MTKLLVSVRDAEEALIATSAEIGILDVKEPRQGSLGAASLATIETIAGSIGGELPLSVALGELDEHTTDFAARLPSRVNFAKVGLAGAASDRNWPTMWQRVIEALPATTKAVAVIYADEERAGSPPAAEVVRLANQFGCAAVLVDTFDKSAGDLLQYWQPSRMADFVAETRRNGLRSVIAGSLTADAVPRIVPYEPDFLAVRGAVCAGGRIGSIDCQRLHDLARKLRLEVSSHAQLV